MIRSMIADAIGLALPFAILIVVASFGLGVAP